MGAAAGHGRAGPLGAQRMRHGLRLGRRALLLAALALGLPAGADPNPLHPDPEVPPRGPARAAGALIWVHAYYTEGAPPGPPPFLAPLTLGDAGWDLWRLDRAPRQDPLLAGAKALVAGTAALRRLGYRQVAVVGESRGAFIAAMALRRPGLADALLLIAPAAHGTRPERRAQALADWRAALAGMASDAVRRAGLVLFADDPYDPDPPARAAAFAAAMRTHGVPALLFDRPVAPIGHGGARDPEFALRFGACLAALLTGAGEVACVTDAAPR